ncbi:hypothetical protein PSN45_005007 [Yamadazyma tenuis]|uniref:uncharacterized protein n=1 Tax=Candida tenuis TaxID=2315449 RepID=UPI0027A0BCC7|nr:hypothetical protein PSN45_005007 [Yamadazyma tenuis]
MISHLCPEKPLKSILKAPRSSHSDPQVNLALSSALFPWQEGYTPPLPKLEPIDTNLKKKVTIVSPLPRSPVHFVSGMSENRANNYTSITMIIPVCHKRFKKPERSKQRKLKNKQRVRNRLSAFSSFYWQPVSCLGQANDTPEKKFVPVLRKHKSHRIFLHCSKRLRQQPTTTNGMSVSQLW